MRPLTTLLFIAPLLLPLIQNRTATAQASTSSAFQEGLADRQAWEGWYDNITGDYRNGALYWSSQRSLAHPGSCKALGGYATDGCRAARERLSGSDAERKSDPDYRSGWISYQAPQNQQVASAPSASPPPLNEPMVTMPAAPVAAQAPAASSQEPAGLTWYVGHMGAETCVPLSDVGNGRNGPIRLYYGGGSMRTPEDFANRMRGLGANLHRVPMSASDVQDEQKSGDYMVMYNGTIPGESGVTGFVFFSSAGTCKYMMANLPR